MANNRMEYTLARAIAETVKFKDKTKKSIVFEIIFKETKSKASFGKVWSKVFNEWKYVVREGSYLPTLVYDESAFAGAVGSIPGVSPQGNVVKYTVKKIKE